MKQAVQKFLLIVLSLALVFVIYRCGTAMKKSGSPYIQFPNKIDTFR